MSIVAHMGFLLIIHVKTLWSKNDAKVEYVHMKFIFHVSVMIRALNDSDQIMYDTNAVQKPMHAQVRNI